MTTRRPAIAAMGAVVGLMLLGAGLLGTACQGDVPPPTPPASPEASTIATSAATVSSPTLTLTPTPTAAPAPPPPSPTPTLTPIPTPVPQVAPQPSEPASASPASPTPSPTPTPLGTGETLTFANLPEMPDLDLYDLAARLRPGADLTPPAASVRQTVGARETFWVIDLDTNTPFQVSAILRAATPHADFYVQEGLSIPNGGIREAARAYEEDIYPRITGIFQPAVPGSNTRPITILHLDLPAVAGYYDSTDEYPSGIYPYTNLRRMLYLNAPYAPPGSPAYVSLLAHELQHAVHWEADRTEEVWINEGLSVLASRLFGGSSGLVQAFLERPSIQLTTWPAQASAAAANYGAAGLLMEFLYNRYPGGDGTLRRFVAEPGDGLKGLGVYLASEGYGVTWRDFLADWAAANYLDGRSMWDPYPDREIAVGPTHVVNAVGPLRGDFVQFAPSYVALDLAEGDYRIRFRAEPRTPLLPTMERRGAFWWSGGEDSADATLTRTFDLRGVSEEDATLRLRLWYDVEEDWDYVYLLASGDGGLSWEFLSTPRMRPETENILGQAFGPGYTGQSGGTSGPQWIDEEADLSAFIGEEVIIRLEYVTDGAVNLNGVAVGGVSIPAIDYDWAGEDDGGWEARGFFLSDGWTRQEYVVRLLLVRPDGSYEVVAVPLDASREGEVSLTGLGSAYREAALLVFPMAPATRQPASAAIEIEPLT